MEGANMPTKNSQPFTLLTGATSGIGLELARQAAADGRSLILVGRNPAALDTVANELKQKVGVHIIVEDLSQPGAGEKVWNQVQALDVEVDCLINDAGFGDYGPFATSDVAKLERMISVNITTLTVLTRLVLTIMLKNRRGQIMNLASVTGFLPGPLMSVYYATKHYVLAFSESLFEELRGSGVTVTALCPPPVSTSFSGSAGVNPSNFMATTKTTPAEVARFGYQMMKRKKPIAVYSPTYKFLTHFLTRITPRFALRRLMHHMNAKGSL
jgi:short-subunit dehydrogenase